MLLKRGGAAFVLVEPAVQASAAGSTLSGGHSDPVVQAYGEWLGGFGFETFATFTARDRARGVVCLPPQTHDRRQPYRPARGSSPVPVVSREHLMRGVVDLDHWIWIQNGGRLPWWCMAFEPHKSRGAHVYHAHVLLGGLGRVTRRQVWAWWFERYGVARVVPMQSGAAFYVAKYAAKDGDVVFSETFRAAHALRTNGQHEACQGRALEPHQDPASLPLTGGVSSAP